MRQRRHLVSVSPQFIQMSQNRTVLVVDKVRKANLDNKKIFVPCMENHTRHFLMVSTILRRSTAVYIFEYFIEMSPVAES